MKADLMDELVMVEAQRAERVLKAIVAVAGNSRRPLDTIGLVNHLKQTMEDLRDPALQGRAVLGLHWLIGQIQKEGRDQGWW